MSVSGATHAFATSELRTGRPDAASSIAQHRAELPLAKAEAATQSVKPTDETSTPRQRQQTGRRLDTTA